MYSGVYMSISYYLVFVIFVQPSFYLHDMFHDIAQTCRTSASDTYGMKLKYNFLSLKFIFLSPPVFCYCLYQDLIIESRQFLGFSHSLIIVAKFVAVSLLCNILICSSYMNLLKLFRSKVMQVKKAMAKADDFAPCSAESGSLILPSVISRSS